MAGTVEGGKKAAAKNMANDPDFYKKLGKLGGSRKVPKGFALDRERAREVGKLGGMKSRIKLPATPPQK